MRPRWGVQLEGKDLLWDGVSEVVVSATWSSRCLVDLFHSIRRSSVRVYVAFVWVTFFPMMMVCRYLQKRSTHAAMSLDRRGQRNHFLFCAFQHIYYRKWEREAVWEVSKTAWLSREKASLFPIWMTPLWVVCMCNAGLMILTRLPLASLSAPSYAEWHSLLWSHSKLKKNLYKDSKRS